MLVQAMQANQPARTANGAKTHHTSKDPVVDLFFLFGASRGKDICGAVANAIDHDAALTARLLLWGRDVRGGAGERQLFRDSIQQLPKDYRLQVLHKVPEVGRWDDVLSFIGTDLEIEALAMIRKALNEGDALCAKWMPRPDKPLGKSLWHKLGYGSPKEYRKCLVGLTQVLETLMCAQKWSDIDFAKLTSMNHIKYPKAFERHCEAAYKAYKESLNKGETKINAGAVYPHSVVHSLKKGNIDIANNMWNALPDYLEGNQGERILPLVDVSYSMNCPAGGDTSIQCMDVAIALGMYLSQRIEGDFRDAFMTFESRPNIVVAKGDLKSRYNTVKQSPWGGSTNIEAAFERILDTAIENNIAEEHMPTMLVILSDMEFDSSSVRGKDVTAFKAAKKLYKKHGYELPKLVFWNLNGRSNNNPVRMGTEGTAMVSGFSPSIMKGILGAKDFTPRAVMMETLMNPRYDLVELPLRSTMKA